MRLSEPGANPRLGVAGKRKTGATRKRHDEQGRAKDERVVHGGRRGMARRAVTGGIEASAGPGEELAKE